MIIRRSGIYKKCIVCKKKFYVQLWRQLRDDQKYCSHKCSNDDKRGKKIDGIILKCKICNKKFGVCKSDGKKRKYCSVKCGNIGIVKTLTGTKQSFETIQKRFKNYKKENHPMWKGGITEKKLKRKLSIHHIDYNKKNNNENNLVSLCVSCHSKTNFNRKYWIKYFRKKFK